MLKEKKDLKKGDVVTRKNDGEMFLIKSIDFNEKNSNIPSFFHMSGIACSYENFDNIFITDKKNKKMFIVKNISEYNELQEKIFKAIKKIKSNSKLLKKQSFIKCSSCGSNVPKNFSLTENAIQ